MSHFDTSTTEDYDGIPSWTFGERLRKARTEVHMSEDVLAMDLGVSVKTLQRWEQDATTPRKFLEVVARVCEVTKVQRAWLLGAMPGQEQSRCLPEPAGDDLILAG